MKRGEDRQDSVEVEEDEIKRWWEVDEDNKGWDVVDGSEAWQGRVHHGVMRGTRVGSQGSDGDTAGQDGTGEAWGAPAA